ncbi:MAG: sulfatase [Opitutales bacterium]
MNLTPGIVTLLCTGILGVLSAATSPINVVWIIADDMSPDTAAYGATGVRTPNLDRLAAEGRRHTRAYATAPVCSSSRSAFILGCYQTTTGLHPHDTENPQPLPAPYKPLPTLLREAGWFVTNCAAPGSQRSGRAITKGKTHYNFAHDPKQLFDGEDWRKRRPGQPFFAQFQITEPHRPFPIPKQFDETALAAVKLPPNYPEHPLTRRDWYAYERSVEVVDERVGAILAQLEKEGVLEETLVMFFADHGRPMPWGKQWLSVEGLQVPLLIRGPGVSPRSIETGLVSLIDLAPSGLQAAGQPIPGWMEGRPVLPGAPADRPHLFAARDRCGDAMDRIRALISPDSLLVRNHLTTLSRLNWSSYKETSYPGMPLLRVLQATGKLDPFPGRWLDPRRPDIEFYDLKSDPLGVHDVAADPANAETIRRQNTALTSWSATSKDQGLLGDPATEPSLAEIQKAKRLDYRRNWTRRLGKPEPTDAERLAWWEQSYGLARGTLAK